VSDVEANALRLNQMISGAWITQGIYVAAELGLADLLAGGPRTAAELARQAGAHEGALYRLLRALASVGIFAEDDQRRFTLTPLAQRLRSDAPASQRWFAIMMGAEFYQSWGHLAAAVRSGREVCRQTFGMPFFEYTTRHPDRGRIYDAAMNGIHDAETVPVLDAYDFSAFRTVVDVGGGNGLALAGMLRRHPGLEGIVFDLPAVAEGARATLDRLGLAGRGRAIGGDFFTAVPAGADAYVLRHILHDWDDEQAAAILRNCRDAMAPGGRILVIESVIPPGNAPCFGKWIDLMMLIVGGRERTEGQFRRLFAAAGLDLRRIVPTAHEVSVIEAVQPSRPSAERGGASPAAASLEPVSYGRQEAE